MKKDTRSKVVFARLPVWLLASPAVRTAPHYARSVLTAFAAQFRGKNNGDLAVTWKMARNLGINSKWQLNTATRLWLERGVLIKTRQGGKKPLGPCLYALAWEKVNEIEGKPDIKATISPPRKQLDEWNKAWLDASRKQNYSTPGGAATEPRKVPLPEKSAPPEVPKSGPDGTPGGAPSRILGHDCEGAAPGHKPKGPSVREQAIASVVNRLRVAS